MRRLRGFSLLELLVSLSILALLLALALISGRGARPNAEVSGGASALADLIVRARQDAMTSGVPTAIGFPSQGGTRAVSGCCYLLSGREHPKVARVYPFGSDYGKMKVCHAPYPGPTWNHSTAAGLLTHVPTLSSWTPYPADAVLYFGADGRVSSNLQRGNGEYRLVCGKEISLSSGQLSAVSNPCTVCVTDLGSVRVEPGLKEGATGLVSENLADSALAPNLSLPANANHPPVLVAPHLVVSPLPEPSSLPDVAPPGATSTVALDGFVTLELYASDPDGDPLSCSWTATGPAGSGSFSAASAGESLDWSIEKDCWVSRWHWRPPAAAAPGELYTLTGTVRDGRGGTVSPDGVTAQVPRVATIRPRKIVIDTVTPNGRPEISVCNFDGTNAQVIVSADQLKAVSFIAGESCSPGGDSFAFSAKSSTTGLFEVWTCGIRGENLRKVMNVPLADASLLWSCMPAWDPRGTYLYVTAADSSPRVNLYRLEVGPLADPSPQLLATLPNVNEGRLEAHPSGKALFFAEYHAPFSYNMIWTDNGAVTTLPALGSESQASGLDASRSRILYFEWGPAGGVKAKGYVMNAATHTFGFDPNPPVTLVPGDYFYNPVMTADGSLMMYGLNSYSGSPPVFSAKNMATGTITQLNIPGANLRDHFPAWTY